MLSGLSGTAAASERTLIVQAARDTAKAAAGKRYTYGGKSISGFDCSGFVAYVFHQVFPDYVYIDTAGILTGGRFSRVPSAASGDLVFFPKGENPYEAKKGNQRVFPDHVGIVLDAQTWISSQSRTGVAEVWFSDPWWGSRARFFLRYRGFPVT